MKSVLIYLFYSFYSLLSLAQKPSLDYSAIAKFPKIQNSQLSNDGKYLYYIINNNSEENLFIRSVDGIFQKNLWL